MNKKNKLETQCINVLECVLLLILVFHNLASKEKCVIYCMSYNLLLNLTSFQIIFLDRQSFVIGRSDSTREGAEAPNLTHSRNESSANRIRRVNR